MSGDICHWWAYMILGLRGDFIEWFRYMCWWEYVILGWRDERWSCDAWFAYVHKSDLCSYECGTWIDVMIGWSHCVLWSDNIWWTMCPCYAMYMCFWLNVGGICC